MHESLLKYLRRPTQLSDVTPLRWCCCRLCACADGRLIGIRFLRTHNFHTGCRQTRACLQTESSSIQKSLGKATFQQICSATNSRSHHSQSDTPSIQGDITLPPSLRPCGRSHQTLRAMNCLRWFVESTAVHQKRKQSIKFVQHVQVSSVSSAVSYFRVHVRQTYSRHWSGFHNS